ncbi:hypothetical protein D3C78_1516800 [compost metagenome]
MAVAPEQLAGQRQQPVEHALAGQAEGGQEFRRLAEAGPLVALRCTDVLYCPLLSGKTAPLATGLLWE